MLQVDVYKITLYPEERVTDLWVLPGLKPGAVLRDKDAPEDARRYQLETLDHENKVATGRQIDPKFIELVKDKTPYE